MRPTIGHSHRLEKMFELLEHQIVAQSIFETMESAYQGGFLADECGMGKTVTMAYYMLTHISNLPQLIVAPCAVLSTWRDWLVHIASQLDLDVAVLVYHGSKRKENGNLYTANIIITTYDILSTAKELWSMNWSRMVLDESHTIKNALSKKAPKSGRAVFLTAEQAYMKWCISATPFNNRIEDLASQAVFIGCAPYNDPKWWKSATQEDLQDWRQKFVLCRQKEGILPAPTYVQCSVESTAMEQKVIEELRQTALVKYKLWKDAANRRDAQTQFKIRAEIMGLITKLRIANLCFYLYNKDEPTEIASEPDLSKLILPVPSVIYANCSKIRHLVDDIPRYMEDDPGRGIVIFSSFTSILSIVGGVFSHYYPDWYIAKYVGSMSTTLRDQVVTWFNSNTHPRILLVSLTAGGVGLSLHENCSTVVILEPYWNNFVEQQAEERVNRIGQKHPVHIYKYQIKNSVESWMLALKHKKNFTADKIGLEVSAEVDKSTHNLPPGIDFHTDISELFNKHVTISSPSKNPSKLRKQPKKRLPKPQ